MPNCTSNYTNDNDSSVDSEAIKMQCSLNYRGFWAPTMHWTQHNIDGIEDVKSQKVIGITESQTISNSHVTSSLTVNIDSLGTGTFFSCRIFFEKKFDGILTMNATNVPDFIYIWNSSVYSNVPSFSHTTDKWDFYQTRKHCKLV